MDVQAGGIEMEMMKQYIEEAEQALLHTYNPLSGGSGQRGRRISLRY